MRKNVYIVVLAVLLVAWCGFIFFMSSRGHYDSKSQSDAVSTFLLSMVWSDFSQLDALTKEYWCSLLTFPIRKGTHVCEFIVLGALAHTLLIHIKSYRENTQFCADVLTVKLALMALAFGVLYAILDEIHQIFVPGRSAEITDVLFDLCGVLVGVLVVAAIMGALIRRRKKGIVDV